jgi:hypothetical protein
VNGITADEEELAVMPTPVGSTMTCIAEMVAPLVVPSTSTPSPFATPLTVIEVVPFWYVVEEASSTRTC